MHTGRHYIAVYCLLFLFVSPVRSGFGGNLDECSDELRTLTLAVSDISHELEELEASETDLEEKRVELGECGVGLMYEMLQRQCAATEREYEQALSEYKFVRGNFEEELMNLENRYRRVLSSCRMAYYPFEIAEPSRRK